MHWTLTSSKRRVAIMILYLMQHGDAVSKDIDPDRPLSETGQADIRRMGEFLERHGERPSRVFHSGKLRAAQTAEILGAAFAPALASEEMEGLGAKDFPDALAEKLSGWTDDVLLVSHMPLVGKLVTRLVCGAEDPRIFAFSPGSIVCVERGGDQRWALNWFVHPDIVA